VTATAWRPSRRTIVLFAAALAVAAVAACARPPALRSTAPNAPNAALDSALRDARADLHAPAVSAAVVACGHVVWANATGVVDVSSMRPAGNGSLFILNSAAKSIVATMIMQEVQSGHLSLSSKLSEFYPWLPNARRITVLMLLNMTSGLPDYLGNQRIEWMIRHRPRHHWTVDQVLTGLGAGLGPPEFEPGHEYQYSDTNYIVLGGILERITHSSIERDFRRLIARPLGITSATFVPTRSAESHLAHPYLFLGNALLSSQWIPGFGVSSAVWGPVFTDGGMAASALDLAKFANALLGGRLVSAAAVRQMTHLGPGNYGFGFRGRQFDGHPWLGQAGIFGGFQAQGWSDPGRHLTVVVATNVQQPGYGLTSNRTWRQIAAAYDRDNPAGTGCTD
jgi:D-alanyl-D-alanine carboxypeptidase